MHAVSFCRCECGIEIKLLQELDGTTQAYTYRCGREIEFLGAIVEIYTATVDTGLTSSLDWKQPPTATLKASA